MSSTAAARQESEVRHEGSERRPELQDRFLGAALTSPGVTAETTVLLESGDYVMECYVVTPKGEFHGSLGMLRPLIVTEEKTGLEPPEADVHVTLSNYAMETEGELSAGEHVIAVHTTEDAEGIILHDVNLARLSADASLDEVGSWMSWIDALRAPAPAHFLGGADHLAGGSTSYFRVSLDPGRYAFVSEGFATKGMVHDSISQQLASKPGRFSARPSWAVHACGRNATSVRAVQVAP